MCGIPYFHFPFLLQIVRSKNCSWSISLFVIKMWKLLAYFVLVILNHPGVLGETITIDTKEDLESLSEWNSDCTAEGYQGDVGDFECPFRLDIPEEDQNERVGFWTGCFQRCTLGFNPSQNYENLELTAYFKEMNLTVVIDERETEAVIISGEKWESHDVNISVAKVRQRLGT